MSRIFKVQVNIDEMNHQLLGMSLEDIGRWLIGFQLGACGKECLCSETSAKMGFKSGQDARACAERFSAQQRDRVSKRYSTGVVPGKCRGNAAVLPGTLPDRLPDGYNPVISNDKESNEKSETNTHAPAEADLFDPVTTATPAPKTDADRWRYEIALEPWAKSIKVAGGKIGPDNWTVWQGVLDRIFRNDCNALLEVMAKLPAGERWPDRVEEESWQGPDGKVARIAQDRQETAKMLRARIIKIRGGECYLKSDEMVKAACQYGLESLDALAKHAKDIGADLSKDLARVWYAGRPSAYNGWDFYEPKKKLDTPLTIEQLSQSLKGE